MNIYGELYEIANKNVVDKDWNVAKELIDELHYPFVDSREDRVHLQLKTITFILSQFEDGRKCVLLDAPTGVGKSLINMTIAMNMEGSSFVTLPQKVLQAQYVREFPGLCTEIKGRGNYDCRMINASCADGQCKRKGKFRCKESAMCEYWMQKELALDAKICVSNFSYFALEGGNAFGDRELLIVDEGDDIAESSILDLCSVTISNRTMRSLYDFVDFKKDDLSVLSDAKELLREEIDGKEDDDPTNSLIDIKEMEDFKSLYGRIEKVEDDWISQRESTFVKGRHSSLRAGVYESLSFKPLSIAKFAQDILWSRSDKYIVSSATILNKDMYVSETGLDFLDKDDIVYVTMGSPFDVNRRPIHYCGDVVGKLTAKEMPNSFPMAISEIMRIIKAHPDERGLIHCTSFKNVTSIYNLLNMSSIADRMIYHTNQTDRNELVRMMMSGETPEDSIVVSPSLTRGVDLKGDLCRFVIIFKVPYPNTLDKRIRIRSKNFRWYSLIALREVIQAYGRGMRSADDRCDTYVLDAGFKGLVNGAAKRSVPKWFKDAIGRRR
ncbi:MAG: helicase C-terminal domain-containing protein [Candidatus Methanospirareceae archaeon]